MVHWIKFKCSLLQYEKLPLKWLSVEYGLPTKFHKRVCKVGDLDFTFENREKEVSYEQASQIINHIREYGLH